jgi:radical SAM-linked protein
VNPPVLGDAYRPDPAYDDPQRLQTALRRRVFPCVGRPGRYLGGEQGAVRTGFDPAGANILLTYPDAYELGISNNGLRILYAGLNAHPGAYADLCFAPWPDMEERLRAERMPLFALESCRPARSFDVFGFSLGYELCYTNVLTMLDLSGVPLLADDRGEGDPIVLGGGHCAANPAVMGPFCDLFAIGDGEELILEVADAVRASKAAGEDRAARLARLRGISGMWWRGKTGRTAARVVRDLDAFAPPATLVPTIEAVHDRLSLEVMRGCVRGCRFCQAGMITRPVRERSVETVVDRAVAGARDLGWNEISLLSLSTCDYTGLAPAMGAIAREIRGTRTSLELPSLRVDALDEDVYALVQQGHPGSFTFAPEAGSQRLRDVVNKNITEQDVLTSVRRAFAAGAKKIKLYFMIGLPTETDDDLEAAIALVKRVRDLAPRGGSQITASFSPFSPKSHTPFQWAGQIPREEIRRRNAKLMRALRETKAKISLRDPDVSWLEGWLGLGDEDCARVLLRAWRLGSRFEGWDEQYDVRLWEQALAEEGVDADAYLAPRDPAAPLPWDGVFAQVDRDFLVEDWRKAVGGETIEDCRLVGGCERCDACGAELQHVFARQLDGRRVQRGQGMPRAAEIAADLPEPAAAPDAAVSGFDPRNADPVRPDRERRNWVKWRDRAPEKCWFRVVYSKQGDAVWLGHLDLQRLFQLALRRAGLPVAYTQGFHPHLLIKFGPPLPVGVAGDSELLDLAFMEGRNGWESRLNAQLPADLRILAAEMVGPVLPGAIDESVHRQDYRAALPSVAEGGPERARLAALIDEFLAEPARIFVRSRPKGDIEIDVRPLICEDRLVVAPDTDPALGGAVLEFSLRRITGQAGLPAHDFLACLCGDAFPEPRHAVIRRTALLMRTDEGEWTTPLQGIRENNQRLWLRRHMSA